MADAISPLKGKCVAGRHGADGDAGVTLGSRNIAGLWQIAGWRGFKAAAAPVLAGLGLRDGGSYRTAESTGSATAWRIAPDKILIECAGRLEAETSEKLAVLDLSHSRAVITVSGPAARDLMSQVISVDASAAAFKPGEFIQTGIHDVGVLIHCTGEDDFDILAPGTWAEAVWEFLQDNALPHGLAIKAMTG